MVVSGEFIETPDGVGLFHRVAGDGDRWVVMPGLGGEFDFEPLARRRRALFFDVRNRGRSDTVDLERSVGLPVEVGDIHVVRAAGGAERVDVVGSSYVRLLRDLRLQIGRLGLHADALA